MTQGDGPSWKKSNITPDLSLAFDLHFRIKISSFWPQIKPWSRVYNWLWISASLMPSRISNNLVIFPYPLDRDKSLCRIVGISWLSLSPLTTWSPLFVTCANLSSSTDHRHPLDSWPLLTSWPPYPPLTFCPAIISLLLTSYGNFCFPVTSIPLTSDLQWPLLLLCGMALTLPACVAVALWRSAYSACLPSGSIHIMLWVHPCHHCPSLLPPPPYPPPPPHLCPPQIFSCEHIIHSRISEILHIRMCWINLYIPYVWSVFRIRNQIRIRIQHFRLKIDPDSIRIQGFDDQKLEKIYSWNRNFIFFWSRITTYASIKDVQTAEEAFIPQKRTSSS